MMDSDLQLVIHCSHTGDHNIVPLDQVEMLIGRPSAKTTPVIALNSHIVSREHAIIRQGDAGWTIEPHGFNETLLNNTPLKNNEKTPLTPGDKLQIAEYTLTVIKKTVMADEIQAFTGFRLLMELEREIHTKLLAAMDLRRDEKVTDLQAADAREKVLNILNELLATSIPAVARHKSDMIMQAAVYQRLSSSIISTGASRNQASTTHQLDSVNDHLETVFAAIQQRLSTDLQLSLVPQHLDEDFERLDKNFNQVFEQYVLDFNHDLREYLVSNRIRRDVLDLIFGLGPLQDLMEMDQISEVMVVCRNQIYIEKAGVVEDCRREFFSDEMLLAVIERIVAPIGRRIDRSSPLVDARLPDGSRVNAVIKPLAVKGPCLTIRKFSKVPLEITDLVKFGALTQQMDVFLKAFVLAHKNIIVSGGTGSGKTTLLNSLSRYIPEKERIITIEDTAELQLKQKHVVTMESRPPNMEGKGAVTIQDLVKNALRMRPDRIVVGECRGAEALDMLQAMNTGHDGSLTTGHANTPSDMMLRLETMVLMGTDMPVSAIREQIKAAIHIVVQLNRFPDGSRRITHISEVTGIDEEHGNIIVQDIFVYHLTEQGNFATGKHILTGYIPSFIDELLNKKVLAVDSFFQG